MKLRTRIVIVYGTIFLFLMISIVIAVSFLINSSFDEVHHQGVRRLQGIIDAEYKMLGERASAEVSKIVKANGAEIIRSLGPEQSARDLLRQIGSGTALDILELGDGNGVILANAQDPARFGIVDKEALKLANAEYKKPVLRMRPDNRLTVEYIMPIKAKETLLAYVIGGYYLKEKLRTIDAGADFVFLLQGKVLTPMFGDKNYSEEFKKKLLKVMQSQPDSKETKIQEAKSEKKTKSTKLNNLVRNISISKWLKTFFYPREKYFELAMINIGRKNYTVGMIPLKSYNDVQLGAIIAAYSDTQSSDIQGRLIRSLIGVAIVGIIAAYSAGYFIAKSVTKPIQDLVEGVEIISKGNLDHQIGTNAQGEIKFLVDSINQMTVSLKKENERRLSAERIAAWQDVARTMAHEIKNPLWPIQLSIRSLKRAYESKSDDFDKIFAECTDTIIEEVESLRRIVDEFSNFARMPKAQLKPENINDIIKDTLALYKNLPESIDIKANLYDNIPKIMADKEQLSRAFINIINNAIQAMPNGGSLTIATSIDETPKDTSEIVDADVKNTVKIIFADTGVGIPSEIKDKVFQPYVTTKKGGTGLGMAIVQRIITEHNGKIEVESEENVGTKFTIFLPIVK